MKNLILLSILLVPLFLYSCQNMADSEEEKQAIMNVILNESETAREGNLDGLISTYLDDENTVRLYYRRDRYEISRGIEEIGTFLEFVKQNAELDLSGIKVSKENPIIKITGKTAWVICDNIWEGVYEGEETRSDNLQVTFLEKAGGAWKISFVTWLPKPSSGEETIMNQSMMANWNFKLKKGVDATELEEMILKEFIPAYEENFAGIKLFLLKSDRGTNQGEYSILLVFDSIDERNEWWPAQDQSSDKAEEAAGRMAEMYEKLQSMIEMGTGNDWLVIK